MFLDSFVFGESDKHVYPNWVLAQKQLDRIEFAPITIFYGGNGSGKSTVLNVIARTIGVRKMSFGNTSDYFRGYTRLCEYESSWPINYRNACFIRSEDIMEGIIDIRESNRKTTEYVYEKAAVLDDYVEGLADKLRDPESMEHWERALIVRLGDGQRLLNALNGREDQYSNGESAMQYFDNYLARYSLFFLDEPENSLDAQFQQQLAAKLEEHVKEAQFIHAHSQFIIATHSPFLMAMEGAKVIDLDSCPSRERPWFELPNMVAYYQFFQKHAHQFGKGHEGQQGENE